MRRFAAPARQAVRLTVLRLMVLRCTVLRCTVPRGMALRLRALRLTGPLLLGALLLGALLAPPLWASVGQGRSEAADLDAPTIEAPSMSVVEAAVLGVVEGVTEFLPISSTGHLLVTGRLFGLDGHELADPVAREAAKDTFDSYAIAIQAGAILAVLALYWRRVASILAGLAGRDPDGRRLAVNLVVAFVPAAVIGLLAEGSIKARLFQPWAIAVAWAVGGVLILVVERRRSGLGAGRAGAAGAGAAGAGRAGGAGAGGTVGAGGGLDLEQLGWRMALTVGVAQSFAMWPGTSRSLVTILAGMAVGLRVGAAVELSFLLGLLTLGAATAYEGLSNGSAMVDAYGVGRPLLGLLTALISAFLAVRWMVGWLQSRGLEVFGWYRLGAAAVLVGLLAVGSV